MTSIAENNKKGEALKTASERNGGDLMVNGGVSSDSTLRPFSKVRVLLDARKVGDGGIGTYIENLARGLILSGEVELAVVARPKGDRSKGERAEGDRREEWWNSVEIIEDGAKPYSFDEYLSFARRLPQNRFDIFHAPHFTLPFGLSMPAVITVHDLIHVHVPERIYYPFIAAPLIRSAVRRARKVITVSESTAVDLRNLLGKNSAHSQKIQVVPNAFDPGLVRCRMDPQEALRTLNVTRPYLLAVLSSVKPHKGVHDLLSAFESVRNWATKIGRPFSEIRLVLAGQGTAHFLDREPLFERISRQEGVHVVGPVSKNFLGELYANAVRVVVPSLAEGFCFPVLESHLFGTPVVCRPVPAIQELLGSSDRVAADFSLQAFIDVLQQSLLEWQQGDCRYSGGCERYSLPTVTDQILDVYHSAVTNETGPDQQKLCSGSPTQSLSSVVTRSTDAVEASAPSPRSDSAVPERNHARPGVS